MKKQTATILSLELVGMQALTESLASDEISGLMTEIHKLLDTGCRMHHGKINRFTGDTCLMIFGENEGNKQAPGNALNAAFDIKERFRDLYSGKEAVPVVGLKIGIAAGQIVSTALSTESGEQSTLMGQALNEALRICQFANENQVLAGQEVFEAAKGRFEFQYIEPIPIKDGTESIPIFEPIKKKRQKLDLKLSSERKIVSDMVGRSREAELLEGLIRNLVAGKGSIVNIVGKAGIGKSRLMAEMKVQPIMEKVLLLEGRALSTGQNLSFHPIANLIKSWAGISEDDLPSVSSEKLYQGIKRNTPGQADEIYAFVATMMGLPLEGKHKVL